MLAKHKNGQYIKGSSKYHILILDSAAAMANVPTVSIFEAMIGIPLYVCLEFLNVTSLNRLTC